jgi:prepilin-type N-terminal cleavage/methylation domain-containing protein
MKNRKTRSGGFTLVEMMIVVALIGMLSVIAIPHWVRARAASQTSACINNLRQIDGAIQQWALETKQAPTAAVDTSAILGDTSGNGYLKSAVTCPSGGTDGTFALNYSVTTVSDPPTCLIVPGKHLLPPVTTE